ncbi:MAG TPA: hypothetical protein GXX48_10360 [Ochrobactrum intermedium]|uniref:DUF6602 domain-containing protein n=1 Tax=Brucella intermedia TaxID=94625 RepID=A0A7V6PBS9_9HYPH|nr:DUF6602 domain-containing protein [Brucella intermedia]HHV68028.1 hypothetical protein [Brucella intermedia]
MLDTIKDFSVVLNPFISGGEDPNRDPRQHYCLDEEFPELFSGTGKSLSEFLAGIKLSGGKVRCAKCLDVHNKEVLMLRRVRRLNVHLECLVKPKLTDLTGIIAKDFELAFARGALHRRPDNTGRPREGQIRKFLGEMLPGKYGVSRGYIVYTRWNNGRIIADVTSEFDVIIFRKDNSPNLCLDEESGTRLIPYDDVYGVVEAKSVLTEQTLADALSKLEEIPAVSHLSTMARAKWRQGDRRPHGPFRMVVAYRGSKLYGTKVTARVPLQERLDHNRYGGGEIKPDAVVTLDKEFLIRRVNDTAVRRALMVHHRSTLDMVESHPDYHALVAEDAAGEDIRALVPEYYSVSVSHHNGPIAFVALLLGLLEEQTLVGYDLGELMCLMQPSIEAE